MVRIESYYIQIVLIGGGKAAVSIIHEFRSISVHNIVGIADINEEAPGIKKATEAEIPVFSDFKQMMNEGHYDIVFELTGVKSVYEQALEISDTDDKIIPANSVKIIYDLIESFQSKRATGAEATERISNEFGTLRKDLASATDLISESSRQIQGFLEEARFISINAGIQSQKAGSYGKTFVPIVEKFTTLIEEIRKVLINVDKASDQSQNVSDNIKKAEIESSRFSTLLLTGINRRQNGAKGDNPFLPFYLLFPFPSLNMPVPFAPLPPFALCLLYTKYG